MAATSTMKSKSSSNAAAAAAAAASLADLHHGGHPGFSGTGSLLAVAPHHLGSPFPGVPTSAAQQILNYAAQLSGKSGTSSLLPESVSSPGGWDSAMALQMSQLFGSAHQGAAAAAATSPDTLAQLNAASQLIAASLIQQQQQQQNSAKESQRYVCLYRSIGTIGP